MDKEKLLQYLKKRLEGLEDEKDIYDHEWHNRMGRIDEVETLIDKIEKGELE